MSATASHGGAMGHYLRIHDDYDEIRLALVCTAAPGSPCRLRPADGREDWTYADADLIDSGVCWAVEWADEGGCVTAAEGVTWPLVPVTVEYEYGIGPVVAPVDLDELLDAALDAAEASVADRFDSQRFASLPVLLSDLRTAEARATAAEVASRGYRERAEKAEAKDTHSAGLLGHQSRTLTDTIASEVLRQKAVAWDEGKAAGLRQSDWEHGDTAGMYIARNPYYATPPTTTEETTHE